MPELNIHLDNKHSVGLGDNLCLLSALANIPDKVNLYASNDHQTFEKLSDYSRIFRVPKNRLELKETSYSGQFPNTGWPIKVFSSYYRPLSVYVNGQVIKLDHSQEKKCIAVAGFYATPTEGDDVRSWPWCKRRDLEYWQRIFGWLKSMDYEVITVDRAGFNLEDKIELLAKHCKAIISYEGGMAHLAHMLRLPCFLIDWKLPSPSTTLGEFHCDFVHRSETVYIVRDDEELFGWDADKFAHMVFLLNQGQTNNRLVNGSHRIEFVNDRIYNDIKVVETSTNNTVLTAESIFGDNDASKLVSKYYWTKMPKSI
jgi:hypothetical protein